MSRQSATIASNFLHLFYQSRRACTLLRRTYALGRVSRNSWTEDRKNVGLKTSAVILEECQVSNALST